MHFLTELVLLRTLPYAPARAICFPNDVLNFFASHPPTYLQQRTLLDLLFPLRLPRQGEAQVIAQQLYFDNRLFRAYEFRSKLVVFLWLCSAHLEKVTEHNANALFDLEGELAIRLERLSGLRRHTPAWDRCASVFRLSSTETDMSIAKSSQLYSSQSEAQSKGRRRAWASSAGSAEMANAIML